MVPRCFGVLVVSTAACAQGPHDSASPPHGPPLSTASLSVFEKTDRMPFVTNPMVYVHVCVECPDCGADATLHLQYRGVEQSQDVASLLLPTGACPGIDLIASTSAGDPASSTVEVSDGTSSIVATFRDGALISPTLSFPTPGDAALCLGQARTVQWSPASDLPPVGETVPVRWETARQCTEACGYQVFTVDGTVGTDGIHYVVPAQLSYPLGYELGMITIALPGAGAALPAESCDGGAACSYSPFRVAQNYASITEPCTP
jgi:hypothetical protein